MSNNSISRLHGIIPPLVTSLTDKLDLDQEGMTRLLKHVIAGEVHGLFILGTTGEAPSIINVVKGKLSEQVSQEVNSHLPWLVGITDTCLENTVDWAHRAKSLGATAIVGVPPFYFLTKQPGLFQFLNSYRVKAPFHFFYTIFRVTLKIC